MGHKDLSFLLGLMASIASIGAGIYLLSGQSAAADETVFDILMHGIGGYFIARGIWMLHEMGAAAKPKEAPAAERSPSSSF